MALMSILDSSSRQSASLLTNQNGSFSFDAVTVEQHTSKLKVTENPIESGANIADHAVLDPKDVSISGIIVGYTPAIMPAAAVTSSMRVVDDVVPMEVSTLSELMQQRANELALTYANANQQLNQPIADFLTDSSLDVNAQSSDRVASAYEKLLLLQRNGEPVSLLTSSKLYKNMILISIQMNQKNRMSGEFSLVLREVFIVETQKVGGINGSKRNLGRTQPQKVEDNRSNLKSVYDAVTNKWIPYA
ncbi:hypothetical protein DES39_0121 [Orbus hercynius]|uniref:Dit-like phage tail protein N-terminal domain-containing protein n=1 Tax=Orbus hercynius TaxID=593135 RepID=A0A495RHL5_9GAMM|nr:hypothetical protein [Orbus hercynius]RKS86915.1 hypothetical protein DES39_0121 [Orbus hercynius]